MIPLPIYLLQSLENVQGFNKESFVKVHEDGRALTSIRLNPQKPTNAIKQLPIENEVPWCKDGLYLTQRPSFTLDPVFHGGAYYVQEASSMFLQHIINQLYKDKDAPKRVLDLCGAPGGKSTLLAASLPNSLIVANEVIKSRVTVLSENITKWGSGNVVVTSNDPKDFKNVPGYFDLMVIDAPCSGSGLFRKDNEAITEWNEDNVQMCSMRQQRILSDAIGSLKQHGYLIYSTCSYSQLEDEDICDWLVTYFNLQPVSITVENEWGIIKTISSVHQVPGYRFYPDKVKGEGFFVACFQQKNVVDEYYGYDTKVKEIDKNKRDIAAPFLNAPDDFILNDQKEIIIAFQKKWEEEYATLWKLLNVRKAGTAIGTIKGKDFIPHHELALSQLINSAVQKANLDKERALQYLRRQNFETDLSQKGWTICRYEDINLGWMKVLPNRVNNYYPTEWRILKA